MHNFEKLGLFYLGKAYDPAAKKVTGDLLLYDSKDLVTHAVCVGMTGSGKTGLCISLIEEAAIDRIPAVIIDPKGDMGNLLLAFPDLRPQDFEPWVNEEEAARQNMARGEFAARQAELWTKGISDWGQDGERIRMFKSAADFTIYTPGSSSGLPISILRSFSSPAKPLLEDADLLRDRISTSASGLLALLGIKADPLQSREHILLSNIFDHAWRAGQDLDLPGIIQRIQNPPFQRVGIMDLDSFYPSQERFKLAMMMNNLLAAPGFQSWMEGDPLEAGSLLFTPEGKPRVSIFSIAHLSDAERMFFVTLLLNQVLGWVRTQPGTTSLRALLYMDEIFGFFPPVAEPPSKKPLLTLLKQARAFGLGVVLSTQNPVDLDYKGLANAGTWFIGRLQTENDMDRLLDGLAGAGEGIDLKEVSGLIAGLGKRVFLMHNVREDRPVLFHTRWALSYLGGPLTRTQVKKLMNEKRKESPAEPEAMTGPQGKLSPRVVGDVLPVKPQLPPGIRQFFAPAGKPLPGHGQLVFRPSLAALGRVSVVDNRLGIAHAEDVGHVLELSEDMVGILWDNAQTTPFKLEELEKESPGKALFESIPANTLSKLKSVEKDYEDFLARTYSLKLWKSPFLKVTSNPGETEGEFRARISQLSRELRDEEVERLRKKYASKVQTLEKQLMTAEQRLQREQEQYKEKTVHTAVSVGATILGAVLGRKTSNIGRATTAARSASRAYYEKMDIQRAKKQVEAAQQRLGELENQFQAAADEMARKSNAETETLQILHVRPKKKDITVQWWGILWLPSGFRPEGAG